MKISIQRILMLAGAAAPLQAIEPPVEARPIPPRNVPAERTEVPPRAVPAPLAFDDIPKARPVVPSVSARPYIGVILDPVPSILSSHLKLAEGEGLVIGELVAGGPAELSGLAVNDLLIEVNGVVVGSPEEVRLEIEKQGVGDQVKLEVIHHGERNEVVVTLGAAPKIVGGIPQQGMNLRGGNDLEGFLGNLPERHAELMRRAMEQGLQPLGQSGDGAGLPENWQKSLLKRMESRMGASGLDLGNFKAESSIRLLDEQGMVQLKGVDGSREVRVFDTSGEVIWEGPYDTDEDKAAVPDAIRERIDQVNLDNMDFGGKGLRHQMAPQRFRPLEDMGR